MLSGEQDGALAGGNLFVFKVFDLDSSLGGSVLKFL